MIGGGLGRIRMDIVEVSVLAYIHIFPLFALSTSSFTGIDTLNRYG